jgi:hypothetical protein
MNGYTLTRSPSRRTSSRSRRFSRRSCASSCRSVVVSPPSSRVPVSRPGLLQPLPDRGLGQVEVLRDLADGPVAPLAQLHDLGLELNTERAAAPGLLPHALHDRTSVRRQTPDDGCPSKRVRLSPLCGCLGPGWRARVLRARLARAGLPALARRGECCGCRGGGGIAEPGPACARKAQAQFPGSAPEPASGPDTIARVWLSPCYRVDARGILERGRRSGDRRAEPPFGATAGLLVRSCWLAQIESFRAVVSAVDWQVGPSPSTARRPQWSHCDVGASATDSEGAVSVVRAVADNQKFSPGHFVEPGSTSRPCSGGGLGSTFAVRVE